MGITPDEGHVMSISTNYSSPEIVNGFKCQNCTDVGLAKQNIDPEHPKSGPFNVNAATDVSRPDTDPERIAAERKSAEATLGQTSGYCADGSCRTATVTPGETFSILA